MSIFVTGAPGWLGTGLVQALDGRDASVRCLTLEGTDTSELDPYDVEAVSGDIRKPDTLDDAFTGDVETVFHCAAIINPSPLFGAHQFYEINADGTENVLSAARDHDVEHFVLISSNVAQGVNASPTQPMTEDMPCRPMNDYGYSKFIAEQHVKRYHQQYGLDYTIIRPTWYYGPRQPKHTSGFMQTVAGGHPIVFGDGTNLRSMTYVPSLVDVLVTIADDPSVAKNETYWIADERPYPTDYIYRTIAECLGSAESLSPIYVPTPVSRSMEWMDRRLGRFGIYAHALHVAGEMSRTIACDPSKAMDHLDFEPPSDLRQGMQESVDWAREHGHL